jgi:hypothetical protein
VSLWTWKVSLYRRRGLFSFSQSTLDKILATVKEQSRRLQELAW